MVMRRYLLAALGAGMLALSQGVAQPVPVGRAKPADWRQGGVCYEIFVRSFKDSDGDGVGDLVGLTRKLDYINDDDPRTTSDLGARCVWLMPVAESPSYHGYDVSNYYKVQPAYGTNAEFRRFVAAAHGRGIAVLVDMVLNHASSRHPYFLEALRDTASPYRSWFRFSKAHPDQPGPWGQDAWYKSPVRDEYYYGVFSPEMPDLNYHTPAVRQEAKKVAEFWLDSMGVDGFRLDAVPFLVESGDTLMNSGGTHRFLHEYADYVHAIRPDAFTVGEVYDSIGAQLPYYPDQLDDYFTFDAAAALLAAENAGSAKGLLDPFLRMQAAEPPTRWSPFLSNHDQPRTMTALGGDVAKARQAATLLLTLPGLPFIYYGEEIGMTGDKPDPRIRTPMQWTPGPAAGFTTGRPWEPLQPDTATANVEVEARDSTSLLWTYRRLIHMRAGNRALARGELVPLAADSSAVAAYIRRDGRHAVLVVANLGGTPLTHIALWSRKGALLPVRYRAAGLLGAPDGAPLRIGSDGRVSGYVPVAVLGARATYVLELRPER